MGWIRRWSQRHDAGVLAALSKQRLTGAELKSLGVLSQGNCYSVLASLEERGLIQSELLDPNKPRRVYRKVPAG